MTQKHRKTQIPRIFGVIRRSRLLEKLQLVVDHKLILICAPPGYGKTTVAAQFAQDTTHSVVWHTIEERERDFPTLYSQTISAFSQVFPAIQELASPSQYEPSELAATVTNYLRDVAQDDLIYVLDDVHLVLGSPACENWLQSLITLMPSKCHVVLLSRTLPTLPLTEMIARREVMAIGQQELRFNSDEFSRLTSEVFSVDNTTKQVRSLFQRLEGWPAGVALALQPLPVELERLLLDGGEGPEALFESLASLMLDAQPPGLRDFLLASSTLTRFTPELAANVLGLIDSASWIDDALNRNLFLSRVPGGLMYHNLFRDFLQRQLQVRAHSQFVALHLQAGKWFGAHDYIDQAYEHYLTAGASEAASDLIDGVLQPYFAQGKLETLLKWSEELSQAGIANPKLLYFAATIHLERFNYEAASGELEQAEELFKKQDHKARLAEVQLQRARMNLRNGHYLAAIAQAEKLLNLSYGEDNLQGRVLRVLGFSYLRLGEANLAAKYLEEALPLSRANGDKFALSSLIQDLQTVYLRLGRVGEAGQCLQEVVALRRALGGATWLALALNDLGYYYHQHGEYQEAQTTFQEGLSVIARARNKRVESFLLWSLADLQRDRGTFREASELYSRALEFTGNQEPSLRCSILISASIQQRWQQKFQEAQALAEEALILAEAHSLAIEQLLAQASCWMIQGTLGDYDTASDGLEAVVKELQKRHAVSETIHVYGLCAALAAHYNDRLAAEQYLKVVLQLLQQGGSWQPLIAEVLYNPALEKIASGEADKFVEINQRINRLRMSRHKAPSVIKLESNHTIEYVYSLRLQTLGKEKLERDGVPVLPAEWRATAARELFFYLFFLGAKPREIISLDFWPDSAPSRVRSNFHTTLYRVRQALGDNVIVFRDERYMVNPDLDIWCDAHEFESLTERAQNLSIRDARTEDLYRRAVDLYQGDFLPLLDADWIISYRERLSETYLDSLIGLGRCAHARRDYKQSLNIFRQALKVDPYREEIHRAIMVCYADQGEKSKIYAQLRQLQKLLKDDLDAEPARETMTLARSLLV